MAEIKALRAEVSELRDEVRRLVDPGRRSRPVVQQEWLSVEQVAVKLNVSKLTVLRHQRNGVLPGVKVGSSWRLRIADLDAMLAAQRTDEDRRREESRRNARANERARARAAAARAARRQRQGRK